MTRHVESIKLLVLRPGPPFSQEVIKHIVKLVWPHSEQTVQHQFDIVTAAHLIQCVPDYVSPTVERRQLRDVAAKLKAAQAAIDALPAITHWRLSPDASIIETAKRAAKLADGITAKRGKGSPKKHTVAIQKQIAAEHAFGLLKGRKLTTMPHGVYYRVAASLYELATGHAPAERALEKPCARVLASTAKSDTA